MGLPVRSFRQFYSVPALFIACSLARGIDLAHAHLGEDLAVLPLGAVAAARADAPLVITVHCSPRHTVDVIDPRTALLRSVGGWIERRIERRAAAVIAITPRLHRYLLDDGLDPGVLHCIGPGVNRRLFARVGDDPFPDAARPRVLFLGRLAAQKGVHVLLDAIPRLRSPASIVFVGDGPERRALEDGVRRLRLGDRVRLSGFVRHDDVPNVLAHADLLVLPSLYEELGSVLLEAMQAGLPVVASRTGGIPSIVENDVNGLLVEPGDAPGLAAAIDRLLQDHQRRDGMRAAARARAPHDWEDVADQVLDIYKGVVARGTPQYAP